MAEILFELAGISKSYPGVMAHVDGRAVLLQRPFHDLDCTHHARAEAARLR